jgi:predicted dehydrogenase
MRVATPSRLGVGLVGSGFMGRAHAFAFNAVAQIFDLPLKPELVVLADRSDEIATAAAGQLGFGKAVSDWRLLVEDTAVDVVAITTPNAMHKPVALAALAAGKAVYCEKPLATTLADARDMVAAAQAAATVTLVGFNYLKNPMISLAAEIARSGEIGEVVGFRGIHAEDYMVDPNAPHSFRTDPQGGGALMDIGSHIVSLAQHLAGPIDEVTAIVGTVHQTRPSVNGHRPVEVDDHGHFLCRFAGGAIGTISASWVTPGRKMQLDFELTGTRGSVSFTQERFNELKLYTTGGTRGREGFTTITAGPDHPPYGAFCPAPGHQLGFNDLKTIEVANLVRAIAGSERASPDFLEAYEIQRVIAAVLRSGNDRSWVRVGDL